MKDPIVNISEYDPMHCKYSKKLLTKENVKYMLKCHGQHIPIQHTLTNKVIILNNQINKAGSPDVCHFKPLNPLMALSECKHIPWVAIDLQIELHCSCSLTEASFSIY